MGSGLNSKKKKKTLPDYFFTEQERKWRDYCIRNDIRISPVGVKDEDQKWRIGINIGPYKKYEKVNISPNIYDVHTIWPEYLKVCKYYYDKYRR
jgi:hypothetical protein